MFCGKHDAVRLMFHCTRCSVGNAERALLTVPTPGKVAELTLHNHI